jgi:hypothetical protein
MPGNLEMVDTASKQRAEIMLVLREVVEASSDAELGITLYTAKLRNGRRVFRYSNTTYTGKPTIYYDGERQAIYGRVSYGVIPLPTAEAASAARLLWEWRCHSHGAKVMEGRLASAIDKRLPGAVVTLGGASSAGYPGSIAITLPPKGVAGDHPLAALVATLPPAGSVWGMEDRKDWLTAAEALFNVFYRKEG